MSELEIRRLELSDAEAFMVYIANWATDTSPFKIDAVKAYASFLWKNFRTMWKKLIEKKLLLKIPIGQQQLNILLY